tara:strand:- start:15 stop:1577 length:1563 start_codon:yes stop_codon:yes gene_type:complete
MKAVIYTRVSSDEQVEGTSLRDQEIQCRRYCEERDIEILEIFTEEGVSAKSANRPEFLRALEYCKENKSAVDIFLVLKLDRFARNVEDHIIVRKTLREYEISLVSATEQIGDSPAEKFMERMLSAVAEFDNETRKQRCSGGMESRIESGIWPWAAPIGYKRAPEREVGSKKTIPDVPNGKLFSILQTGLREFARGEHTQASLQRRWKELGVETLWGHNMTPQNVQAILEEPRLRFYAGELYNPWKKHYVQGLHVPMLTKDEAQDILDTLSGKKRQWKQIRESELFPLRGDTVLCSGCGAPITGSSSKGRSRYYHYYHCHTKTCPSYGKSIRKDDLEKEFIERLNAISPSKEFIEKFKEEVVKEWKIRTEQYESVASENKTKIQALEKKLENIYSSFEDGIYTPEVFQKRKDKIESQIRELSTAAKKEKISEKELEDLLAQADEFAKALGTHWKLQPLHTKKRFQNLVFPEGITYSRKTGLGTGNLGLIFEIYQVYQKDKIIFGGLERNRTPDLLSASEAL